MELLLLAAVMVLVIVVPMAALTAVTARAAHQARSVLETVEHDHHQASGIFPVQWTLTPDGAPVEGLGTLRQAVLSLGYVPWTRFEGIDTGMTERVEGELHRNRDGTVVVELAKAWPRTSRILSDSRITGLGDAVQQAFAERLRPATQPTVGCTFTSFVLEEDGSTTRVSTTNAGGPPVEMDGFRVIPHEEATPITLARMHAAEIGGRRTQPAPDDATVFLDGEQEMLARWLESHGWLGPPDADGRRHFTETHWRMLREAAGTFEEQAEG